MSTAAQVAEIVRPFLERHADFELVGRTVVLKPVRHVLRSFFIDRTSAKGHIQPSWTVCTLFAPPPRYTIGVGARLIQGVGYVDRPDTQVRLLAEMELITSDILRGGDDMDSWPALAWRAEPVFGPGPLTFAMPLIAKGAFAQAIPYVAQTLTEIDVGVEQRILDAKNHRSPDSRPARIDAYVLGRVLEAQRGYRALHDLLRSGDAVALAAQLHAWEAAGAKEKKVEHLWEPSPFPFEVGAEALSP